MLKLFVCYVILLCFYCIYVMYGLQCMIPLMLYSVFQIKNKGKKRKISIVMLMAALSETIRVSGIEKTVPRITVWHHEACK